MTTRSSRNITVKPSQQQITYLDKKGELQHLGNVVIDDYNREVKRFMFEPNTKNPWANDSKKFGEYTLGTGSKSLGFVNPAAVQQMVIDAGWEIADQVGYKGGLQMRTTFIAPDKAFADTIDYDAEFWSNRKEAGKIYPSITVDTNLTIGRVAARITPGLFRLICTNGLTSQLLGLESVSFNHREWEDGDILEAIDFEGARSLTSIVKGPEVGKLSAVLQAANVIRRYQTEIASEDGLSAPMKFLGETFKSISANVVKPWAIKAYLEQLDLLAASSPDKTVHVIDLLNAYTNGINARRLAGNDRASWVVLDAADSVLQTTTSLVGYASIFGKN